MTGSGLVIGVLQSKNIYIFYDHKELQSLYGVDLA